MPWIPTRTFRPLPSHTLASEGFGILTVARLFCRWWYPYVQQRAKWAIRQWYNVDSNEMRACQREGWCWVFNDTLYARWRRDGASVVSAVHRLRPALQQAVDARWRELNPNNRRPVLSVHLRGTDKASGRAKTNIASFDEYLASFIRAYPAGLVVVATDSNEFAARMVRGLWRTRHGDHFAIANITTRGKGRKPNFDGRHDKMLVASDVLVDIHILAKGDFMVHTSSAVSEAAIYHNLDLHCNSHNLEYAHNASLDAAWLLDRPPRAGCTVLDGNLHRSTIDIPMHSPMDSLEYS